MEDSVDIVIRETNSLKEDLEKCKNEYWYKSDGGETLMTSINSFLEKAKKFNGI